MAPLSLVAATLSKPRAAFVYVSDLSLSSIFTTYWWGSLALTYLCMAAAALIAAGFRRIFERSAPTI